MTTEQPMIHRVEERTNGATGEVFNVLILQQLLPVVSASGNVSIRTVEVSVPSNAPLAQLSAAVGSKLPGSIERSNCAPYQWEAPDGSVHTLTHTYTYNPNASGTPAPVAVPQAPVVAPQAEFAVDA